MLGGRRKLPVIATISTDPVEGAERVWSLRREDLEQLGSVRERLGQRRTVLVSGDAGRGAALAVALAATAAGSGLRTVLLECDLAEPRLAAELGLRTTPGLHEYLRWEASAPEIVQPLTLAGAAAAGARHPLACISAGRPAADPTVLFGLASFRHMFEKLARAYERVVVSGPALELAPDGIAAVAEHADCLLAGISPAQSSGRERRTLRSRLGRLPVEPLGAVVIGAAR